jgi:hypothetical protein
MLSAGGGLWSNTDGSESAAYVVGTNDTARVLAG